MWRILPLICVLAGVRADGQTLSMSEVLSGKIAPVLLKLEELDSSWRKVSVNSGSDSGYLQAVASLYGGASAYFTRGQTIVIGTETYIIAYKPAAKPFDFTALTRSQEPPKPEKLKATTALWLSLLNLRTLGSLSDIRPFNLEEEIASGPDQKADTAALKSASISNLKQIGLAMLMYSQDYKETLPPMSDAGQTKVKLMPYVKNEKIFVQPDTKDLYRPNPALSRKKLADVAAPAETVAFYEPNPMDGTRGAVFVDGHAKRIPEAEWAKVKKASKIPN
jgi:hypothetical protein